MKFNAIKDIHEVMRKMYECEDVYVIFKISKESTFEDVFGADGFVCPEEEKEIEFVTPASAAQNIEQETEPKEGKKNWSKWDDIKDEILQNKKAEDIADKIIEAGNKPDKKAIDWQQVDKMKASGKTYKQIAMLLGVNDTRVISGGHLNWKQRQAQRYEGNIDE